MNMLPAHGNCLIHLRLPVQSKMCCSRPGATVVLMSCPDS